MKTFHMNNDLFIYDLETGKGSPKYYVYWAGGTKLRAKKDVYEAIKLKLRVLRQDKITKEVQIFNYKTLRFEKVK